MAEYSVVGKSIPKIDGPELVTGRAVFSIDELTPRMLHGKILTSPHAHANIRSIDTSKAKALPGVRAVLTHEDVLDTMAGSGTQRTTFGQGMKCLDSKVRFVGDEVAAVAADTEQIALEALKLIDVDYEVLQAVFDPEEAAAPGAPKLYDELESNVRGDEPGYRGAGDPEAGFQASYKVYEDVLECYPQIIACMGRYCAVASWEGDKLFIIDSSQTPYYRERELAVWLGIPQSRVRVQTKFTSLGMGEGNTYRYIGIAAWLAKMTGRTVKVIADEQFHYRGSNKRRARARIYLKVGVEADGTPLAMTAKIYWDKGCDYSGGPSTGNLTGRGQYVCPNTQDEHYTVVTNTSRNGAYRHYGRPEVLWTLETMMDRIANDLGIDPLDYRVKYCGTGQSNILMQRAADRFGWKAKWHEAGARTLPNGKKHGMGMGVTSGSGGYGMRDSSATIRINADGSAMLAIGVSDCGTGSKTTLSQVAAECLGMPFSNIEIAHGDTALPKELGSLATRVAKAGGMAVYQASEDLKQQLFPIVALELEVSPEDLDVGDGKIFSKTDSTKSVTWKEASSLAANVFGQDCITGWGYNKTIGIQDDTISRPGHMWEIEVDTETGEVEVTAMLNFYDIGQSLNPAIVETQLTCCAHIALGYAIIEDEIKDPETGYMLNGNRLEYKLASILELPTVDLLIKDDEPNPCTPHGQRGVGEPPMGGYVGLNNAIYNAIGVSSNTNPMPPDKILKLLGKA